MIYYKKVYDLIPKSIKKSVNQLFVWLSEIKVLHLLSFLDKKISENAFSGEKSSVEKN